VVPPAFPIDDAQLPRVDGVLLSHNHYGQCPVMRWCQNRLPAWLGRHSKGQQGIGAAAGAAIDCTLLPACLLTPADHLDKASVKQLHRRFGDDLRW
jgi:hypothetical protein